MQHQDVVTSASDPFESDHTEPLCSGPDVMRPIRSVYGYLLLTHHKRRHVRHYAVRETGELEAVISNDSVTGSGAVGLLLG